MTQDDLKAALEAVLGPKGVISDASSMEPYLTEERGRYWGTAALVARPASTEEVAEVVRICAERDVPIVPQGGNTGLVGGAVPDGGVVLSLGRMKTIRALDPVNQTITVDAGCILADIQTAADEAGFLFPLSLAAEGSCQIGGNLATNAGGVQVLRYGNARDLVLGIEAVMADGRIWNGLRGLRKDNTGYDLKHLIMGSEGTLGIITGAVLKMFPKPRVRETAFCGLPGLDAVIGLFTRVRDSAGDALTAFEYLSAHAMAFTTQHIPDNRDPFDSRHPCYVLMELTSPRAGDDLRSAIETVLEGAFEDGVVSDAVIAENESQRQALWNLRESVPEAQKHEGGSIKHDIAVPVSLVAEFITEASAVVEKELPGVRICDFGHIGDGNIHFNLSQPLDADRATFLGEWERINHIVHDIVAAKGGSFSAEHGVGKMKVSDVIHYKSVVEVDMMRTIKRALDPKNILNPGKVIDLN
ncbi:MAG: FAD-binding oxidoreductase [Rhodospirillales bacterium]|nr:FAD-binding oxidoreductase [Rhodospirillales bacterium]